MFAKHLTGLVCLLNSNEDFVCLQYAKGPLLDGLYWETWPNNDTIDGDDLGYIYYENKLLGVPRLRQLKVHNNSCQVVSPIHSLNNER